MRSDLFQHEIGRTSSVFGRKHDVRVVFAGDGAATDGSTIILPSMAQGADVSEEQASVMRGYVDHEAGHVRHTDFEALRAWKPTASKLAGAIQNALEDIWLERRVRSEYPGAERNLRATATAVNKEFLSQVKAGDERLSSDKFIAAVAITWEGRKDYGGETCQQCLDLLDSELRAALRKWVGAIDGCKSTSDIITLTEAIEKSIEDQDYRTPPPPTGGSGASEEEQEGDETSDDEGADKRGAESDGDADGASDGAGSDVEAGGSDAGGSGGADERSDGDMGERGERAKGGEKRSGHEAINTGGEDDEVYEDFDLSGVVKRMAEDAGLLDMTGESYRPFSTAHDKWHHRTDRPRKYGSYTYGRDLARGEARDYDQMVQSMAGDVNVMRRKLERALLATQMRDWDHGREAGRLDTRRLTSAYAGRSNVFKMRSESREIDTALTMLVDLSGSMYGHEAMVAQQCVAAIAEAVDRTGIAYEVLGFNNRSRWLSSMGPEPEHEDIYGSRLWGRVEPLDMYVFKDFGERLFEAKGAMSRIHNHAQGNNTDGEAVMAAYQRLKARGERRKVLMTFSDGYPAAHSRGGDLQQHLRDTVSVIERDGVDLIGVGIGSRSVEHFYPRWVVVDRVSDLAASAMDQIAKCLLGERFQIDNSKLLDARRHAV